MSDRLKALVIPTDIPGLYDVEVEDGRRYGDLTTGQLIWLVGTKNWEVVAPEPYR